MGENIVPHSPITRRHALRTGGLATLAAGFLGATGSPDTTTAAPATTLNALTISTTDHLAALDVEWQEYADEARVELENAAELSKALTAVLTPVQRRLFDDYVEALSDHLIAAEMAAQIDLRRHLPGLAPVLAMAQLHVVEGRGQCTLNPGYRCFAGSDKASP